MFSIELFWISEPSMKVSISIKDIIRKGERFDAEALN